MRLVGPPGCGTGPLPNARASVLSRSGGAGPASRRVRHRVRIPARPSPGPRPEPRRRRGARARPVIEGASSARRPRATATTCGTRAQAASRCPVGLPRVLSAAVRPDAGQAHEWLAVVPSDSCASAAPYLALAAGWDATSACRRPGGVGARAARASSGSCARGLGWRRYSLPRLPLPPARHGSLRAPRPVGERGASQVVGLCPRLRRRPRARRHRRWRSGRAGRAGLRVVVPAGQVGVQPIGPELVARERLLVGGRLEVRDGDRYDGGEQSRPTAVGQPANRGPSPWRRTPVPRLG
jgi:hypothetical protein